MDAANVRDIVNRSGVSPGTFYNYFRTKQAIFEVLSQDLLERIRAASKAARSKASTLEELLSFSYEAYFNFLRSVEGASDFIDRNQHHIRSQLYPSSAVSGLTADLEQDLRRFLPSPVISRPERLLIASIVIAAGAEAVLQSSGKRRITTEHLRRFLTKLVTQGVSGWQP